jgi:hypothetical protein
VHAAAGARTVAVYPNPAVSARVVARLDDGDAVLVLRQTSRWANISGTTPQGAPFTGWVPRARVTIP